MTFPQSMIMKKKEKETKRENIINNENGNGNAYYDKTSKAIAEKKNMFVGPKTEPCDEDEDER